MNPITYSYHFSPEYLYVLKDRGDVVVLKIFNIAREIIYRASLSRQFLANNVKNCKFLTVSDMVSSLCNMPVQYQISSTPIDEKALISHLLKELIAGSKYCQEVPVLSDNPEDLASVFLSAIKIASNLKDSKQYVRALEQYNLVFKLKSDALLYKNIPDLFIEMGQNDKAVVSFLYYVSYLVEENKIDVAIQSLKEFPKDKDVERKTEMALFILYIFNKDATNAYILLESLCRSPVLPYFIKIAKYFIDKNRDFVLNLVGDNDEVESKDITDIYGMIGSCISNPQLRGHFLLEGVWREKQRASLLFQHILSNTIRFEEDLIGIEAQAIDPTDLIGRYERDSQLKKACSFYKWRLSCDPCNREVRSKLTQAYTTLEKPALWKKRAVDLFSQGQMVAAEKWYRKGFYFFSESEFGFGLASILKRRDQLKEALVVLFQLFKEMMQVANYTEAKKALCELEAINPDFTELGADLQKILQKEVGDLEGLEKIEDATYGAKLMRSRKDLSSPRRSSGLSPLIETIKKGYLLTCQMILAAVPSIDIDITDLNEQTAVMYAVFLQQHRILKQLLLHSQKPNLLLESNLGLTPLMMAVILQDMFAIEALSSRECLEFKTTKELKISAEAVESVIGKGGLVNCFKTFLEEVLKQFDRNILSRKELTENTVLWSQFTPLMIAALIGSLPTVSLLIEKGACQIERDDGIDPMACAAAVGSIPIIQRLELSGGKIQKEGDKFDAFIVAAAMGKGEIVKYFIEKGVDINQVYSGGMTALIFAILNMHLSVIRQLLENKVESVLEAFKLAIQLGNNEVIKIFTKLVDDKNIMTEAREYAKEQGKEAIVSSIILLGLPRFKR